MLKEEENPVSLRSKPANGFVIQRVLSAHRDLVWKALGEADQLEEWLGPAGFILCVSKLEFSSGGTFHFSMESPEGFLIWGKFVYLQIIGPEKLVFITSFSDENGGVMRAPMSDTWPLEVFNILTLAEYDGKTFLTLKCLPIHAGEAKIKTFEEELRSLQQGFTATLNQLEKHLSKFSLFQL